MTVVEKWNASSKIQIIIPKNPRYRFLVSQSTLGKQSSGDCSFRSLFRRKYRGWMSQTRFINHRSVENVQVLRSRTYRTSSYRVEDAKITTILEDESKSSKRETSKRESKPPLILLSNQFHRIKSPNKISTVDGRIEENEEAKMNASRRDQHPPCEVFLSRRRNSNNCTRCVFFGRRKEGEQVV